MPNSTAVKKGHCPLCGETNPQNITNCHRCGYRLPWADVLEGMEPDLVPTPAEDKIDQFVKSAGLLPSQKCVCRYCHKPIEVDARQCPHCEEWLVYKIHVKDADPWERNFDPKSTKKVDMIQPRGGCMSVLVVGIVVQACWRWFLG